MVAVAGKNVEILITATPAVTITDEALTDSGNHTTFAVTTGNAAHRYWDDTATFVVQKEVDDLQTVSLTGSPGGGTFTLTFGANTTTGIAFNAAASAVQSALVALGSIGSGNVGVSGANGGPWLVEFKGSLGYAAQSLMTKDASGLTGGTSPDVSIVHTQTGTGWTTAASSGYTLQYVGGKVTFASTLAGTPAVRIHSGKYLPFSAMADATKVDASGDIDVMDSTSFTTNGSPITSRTYKPTLIKNAFKIHRWYVDNTFLSATSGSTRYVLSILPDVTAAHRLEGFAFTKSDGIGLDVAALDSEDVEFTVTGNMYIV